MRHVDFAPLYRSTVGFDRLFSLLDTLATPDNGQTYPPYNIERTGEDAYRISMAVAGFSDDEISIEAHRNVLTVKGERAEEKKEEGNEVLYRGIASRAFERRFQLADHVEVTGASLKNGLLHIELKRDDPGRAEAAQDRDCQRPGQSQADRSQGRLTAARLNRSRAAPSGAAFVLGRHAPRSRSRSRLGLGSSPRMTRRMQLSRSARRTHRHRRRWWRSW